MPSKKMEEFLKKASPDTLSQVREAGQTLQNNGAQEKPMNYAPQAPPNMGEPRPHAAAPKLNENLLSAQDKPENAVSRAREQSTSPKQEATSQQKEMER